MKNPKKTRPAIIFVFNEKNTIEFLQRSRAKITFKTQTVAAVVFFTFILVSCIG